jgi:hypothetical protein
MVAGQREADDSIGYGVTYHYEGGCPGKGG